MRERIVAEARATVAGARLSTMIVAVLTCALLLGGGISAAHAAQECPEPRVRVFEWMPDDPRESRAQNLVTLWNRDGIRFLMTGKNLGHRAFLEMSAGVSLDLWDEYILTTSSTADAITMNLVDGKGRPVASATGGDPESVAQQMTPMLQMIRDHQSKVREDEHIAIDSWVYSSVQLLTLEVDMEETVTFELVDCDGYVLADREVEIELTGPGEVEPQTVTTDGDGRGEFTYVATDPGQASVMIWYVHDCIELEGVKYASGQNRVQITVEGEGARVFLEMSGDGYTATYDAWNCDGLEGDWQLEGELVIEGYGTISGGGSLYFPPRPEEGPWDSEPFSYSMEGTLDMGDAVTDILYEFEDVVFTIIELEDGPTLGDARGTAKATVRVTTPDFSAVVSETYSPLSIAPALIRSETHPSCGD